MGKCHGYGTVGMARRIVVGLIGYAGCGHHTLDGLELPQQVRVVGNQAGPVGKGLLEPIEHFRLVRVVEHDRLYHPGTELPLQVLGKLHSYAG